MMSTRTDSTLVWYLHAIHVCTQDIVMMCRDGMSLCVAEKSMYHIVDLSTHKVCLFILYKFRHFSILHVCVWPATIMFSCLIWLVRLLSCLSSIGTPFLSSSAWGLARCENACIWVLHWWNWFCLSFFNIFVCVFWISFMLTQTIFFCAQFVCSTSVEGMTLGMFVTVSGSIQRQPIQWMECTCAVLWCAVLCCAVLCCAVLCCAVLCCIHQTFFEVVDSTVSLFSQYLFLMSNASSHPMTGPTHVSFKFPYIVAMCAPQNLLIVHRYACISLCSCFTLIGRLYF